MSWNEDAADAVIGHRLALLRYEAGTARAMVEAYDAALADVEAERLRLEALVRAGTPINAERITRLYAVGNQLAARIRELRPLMVATTQGRLTEAAEAERRFQARLFRTMSADVHFAGVPDAAVALAVSDPLGGSMWADRIAVDLFEAQSAIRAVIASGMARGASMPQIARGLREMDTIAATYRGRLISIARTETQRVANDVATATYEANADVLDGMQLLATLDSRTCAICAPDHNRVYAIGAPRPDVPRHPRCRCFFAPVSKPWSALGFPAEMDEFDGRPAEDTTFDAWLRRQPARTADEILGPTRAAMWRAGTPLARFSDGRRVLNLGELAAGA